MTLSVNASIALRALRAILYNTRSELGTSKRFKIATHTKKGASVGLSSTFINKLTRRKSCIMAMCIQQSGSGGDAVEAACFLVRKHESGGAGDVRLLTATPPSPPPGNEPGPGGEVPNLGGKRGGQPRPC